MNATKAEVKSNGQGSTLGGNPLAGYIDPKMRKFLQAMGYNVPENVKEITTEVKHSEEGEILIPRTMTKLEAAQELEKQWHNEETIVQQTLMLNDWFWKDVLINIKKVTEREFGWMQGKSVWGQNPMEIEVVTDIVDGKEKTEKAFYGRFEITAWGSATANLEANGGRVTLNINAKKKYGDQITRYFALIREELKTNSIYKAKSVVITGSPSNINFDIIENIPSDKIVLNEDARLTLDNFILPSLKEKGKRCYLFTGGYGNGKTETAMEVGVEANKLDISFFYIKDAKLFDAALTLAKQYQPAVLFLEDIDEIAAGEQRDSDMNKILNTLDGVQTKGNNLTVLFTTNHPEKINSGLRRPGRIDFVVKFEFPNVDSKAEIIKRYFDGKKGADKLNYIELAERMPEAQGSVVAEICKRALQLYNRDKVITTDSFNAATESIKFQLELMGGKADVIDPDKAFVKSLKKLIAESIGDFEPTDVESAVVNASGAIAHAVATSGAVRNLLQSGEDTNIKVTKVLQKVLNK